jgi:hypothetical protein
VAMIVNYRRRRRRREVLEENTMNEWVLIATCKQLVWSIRIDRNIPIWFLCLILGSGPVYMGVTRWCYERQRDKVRGNGRLSHTRWKYQIYLDTLISLQKHYRS